MSQYDGHDSGGGTAGRGSSDESDEGSGPRRPGPTPGPGREPDSSDDDGSGTSLAVTLGLGAVLGLVAYGVNYGLVYAFTALDSVDFSTQSSGPDYKLELVGQMLHNAQFAPVKWESEAATAGETARLVSEVNYVTGSVSVLSTPGSSSKQEVSNNLSELIELGIGSTVPTVIYHVAPFVVLFFAGLVLVVSLDAIPKVSAGAIVGALVTVGTLVGSLLGVFLFSISVGDQTTVTMAPKLLMSVALVGLAIPLVASALGGAVGSLLKQQLAKSGYA